MCAEIVPTCVWVCLCAFLFRYRPSSPERCCVLHICISYTVFWCLCMCLFVSPSLCVCVFLPYCFTVSPSFVRTRPYSSASISPYVYLHRSRRSTKVNPSAPQCVSCCTERPSDFRKQSGPVRVKEETIERERVSGLQLSKSREGKSLRRGRFSAV